jgi:hypothetical protein
MNKNPLFWKERTILSFTGLLFFLYGLFRSIKYFFVIVRNDDKILNFDEFDSFTLSQILVYNIFIPLLLGSILLINIRDVELIEIKKMFGRSLLVWGTYFYFKHSIMVNDTNKWFKKFNYPFEREMFFVLIPLLIGSILMINLGVEKTDKLD